MSVVHKCHMKSFRRQLNCSDAKLKMFPSVALYNRLVHEGGLSNLSLVEILSPSSKLPESMSLPLSSKARSSKPDLQRPKHMISLAFKLQYHQRSSTIDELVSRGPSQVKVKEH